MYSSRRPLGKIPYTFGPRFRSDNNIVITESVILVSFFSNNCPYIRNRTWLGSPETGVWVEGNEQ